MVSSYMGSTYVYIVLPRSLENNLTAS